MSDHRGKNLQITGIAVSELYQVFGHKGLLIGPDLVLYNDGRGNELNKLVPLGRINPTYDITRGLEREAGRGRKVLTRHVGHRDMLALCLVSGLRPPQIVEADGRIILPAKKFGKFEVDIWTTEIAATQETYTYAS